MWSEIFFMSLNPGTVLIEIIILYILLITYNSYKPSGQRVSFSWLVMAICLFVRNLYYCFVAYRLIPLWIVSIHNINSNIRLYIFRLLLFLSLRQLHASQIAITIINKVSESMQKLFWNRSESVLKIKSSLKSFWISTDILWALGTVN